MSAHDAGYLARQIGKTANWVRRNAASLPHSRSGRTYFWTDEDVVAVLETMRVRPDLSDGPTASGELRPLASRRRSA